MIAPIKPQQPGNHRYLSDDDEHEKYAPVGIDGLLGATEKLLAVNRGLAEPDDRDSLPNDRIFTPDRLMAERVKLDHGKTLRTLMGRLSRAKTLRPMGADAFAPYTVGYITSNPLVPALEEINPYHILEQKRRITKMGPGGIGDPNAITAAMQAVNGGQFGFVDPIAGPESCHRDTLVFCRQGWVPVTKLTMEHETACLIDDRLEFRHPEKVIQYPFEGELIGAKSKFLDFLVTPTHRIWHRDTDGRNLKGRHWQMKFAENLFGRSVNLSMAHGARLTHGAEFFESISGLRLAMTPWCRLLAYWLADGSHYCASSFRITHSVVCPAYAEICEVLDELELKWRYTPKGDAENAKRSIPHGDFFITSAPIAAYLKQFGKSGDKFVPEFVQDQSFEARQGFVNSLMQTDCRVNLTHRSFVSTSKTFARGVERLMVGLGHAVSFREEPDSRGHVASTNWIVSTLKNRERQTRTTYNPNAWYREQYVDDVFCVTVPGGKIFTRFRDGYGHWTGNSERAGIDVRLALGARIGSDGRVYQIMRNRKTGRKEWVSPSMLKGKTLKIPD